MFFDTIICFIVYAGCKPHNATESLGWLDGDYDENENEPKRRQTRRLGPR